MSWMDSWSRPSKQTQFPPPLYLTAGGSEVPYCHTCGRVISTRRGQSSAANISPVKYCSERCRRTKPGKIDAQVEDAFVALLHGDAQPYRLKYAVAVEEPLQETGKIKKSKGDPRTIVWCSEVEALVFGSRFDPEKTAGRKKNRTPRGVPDVGEWKSVDMEDKPLEAEDGFDDSNDSDELEDLGGVNLSANPEVDRDHVYFGAGRRRPSQSKAEVNGSIGGEKGWAEKIEETDEMLQKRREGQKRAEEKEIVRRAARRGVAFGFVVDEAHAVRTEVGRHKKGAKQRKLLDESTEETVGKNQSRRKCEAVITKTAVVVEPTFAKGDWGVRWREET